MNTFGLIGYPLSHSFSHHFFEEKFNKEGIKDTFYHLFELPTINDLPFLLTQYSDLKGFNVTIPYKEKILSFLDESDAIVKTVGAANCIKIIHASPKSNSESSSGLNSKLMGYNTDVYGFCHALKPLLIAHHQKALILGTGGAAKAVAVVLQQLNIEYLFVSRKKQNGNTIGYENLNQEIMNRFAIVINTTPLGMHPAVSACPSVPFEYITGKHLVFDLIYNPEETLLIKLAREKGATVSNGVKMLHLQAEKSWDIWNEK